MIIKKIYGTTKSGKTTELLSELKLNDNKTLLIQRDMTFHGLKKIINNVGGKVNDNVKCCDVLPKNELLKFDTVLIDLAECPKETENILNQLKTCSWIKKVVVTYQVNKTEN